MKIKPTVLDNSLNIQFNSKISDKDLLELAGELAIRCEDVIFSNAKNISIRIKDLELALEKYNNAIMQATEERNINK